MYQLTATCPVAVSSTQLVRVKFHLGALHSTSLVHHHQLIMTHAAINQAMHKTQSVGSSTPGFSEVGLWIDVGASTVRVISPVQSEHTCSDMRYCNHRDQCPWRCFTARQDNKHTLVGLSRPPRKANVAPGKCRSTEQFSQTISAVKTGVQVESMLVRKRLRHRYPALTMVCAKTGQLSTVVSSFGSKAMA